MAAKKKQKPHGHYCKVCGEHKANEKFSGKGHAAHICKSCMKLSPAERSEDMTLHKIQGMAFRHLSEPEIKWLRNRMKDSCPEVREAAIDAHRIKFPHYERNTEKKGLTAFSLEFFLHGEIWDEWGDEISVHMRFFADDTGLFRRIDYNAPEDGGCETEIRIEPKDARKFLKAVVHELNAPFWAEDLSDAGPDDSEDYDPYFDGEEAASVMDDTEPLAEPKEPLWSLSLELNNGEERKITFYHQMHDEPQGLFWSLCEWFEPDGNEFDSDEYGDPF